MHKCTNLKRLGQVFGLLNYHYFSTKGNKYQQ
jgi:hypothetical protein